MHEAVCIPTHVLKAPKPLLQHLALQGVAVKWEVIGDEALEIGQLLSLQLVQVVPPPPKRVLHGIISSSQYGELGLLYYL